MIILFVITLSGPHCTKIFSKFKVVKLANLQSDFLARVLTGCPNHYGLYFQVLQNPQTLLERKVTSLTGVYVAHYKMYNE